MSTDNNPKSEKKGFPGGFFIFLLAALLIILVVQSVNNEPMAKVSFSHQVEHLVNLDLIQTQESRKVALNDNLVTFSGKFKDSLSDDAKVRDRYLDVLNSNHELTMELNSAESELGTLKPIVSNAADWFLKLSGLSIPEGGFRVVDPVYDTPTKYNSILISALSDRSVVNLQALLEKYKGFSTTSSQAELSDFESELNLLLQGFRSPSLGIGDENMKQTLKSLDQALSTGVTPEQKLVVYKNTLMSLTSIVSTLNKVHNNIRLIELRSVRSYKLELDRTISFEEELEKNLAQLEKARKSVSQVIWFFNNKELSTRALEKQDVESFSQWYVQAKVEWDHFVANKGSAFKAPDQPRNNVLDKMFKSEQPAPNYLSYLLTLMPVFLVVLLLYFVFSRQMKGAGSGAMSFGKSPAKLLTKEKNKITFKDVAGCDEAKEELQEIVGFLKDPTRYTALGARIPKGVLCIGAPGTGKTLIAKAVAGEADRPFFSISGSDFVEMFVGVGASRIRDLFEQAKKQAPCIIFMDEIDAVGRHRGSGVGGGHDEREQTLNQLLVEMDGFETSEGVILIAATNRPDVLDKALLRPGRFDRRVVIDLPDIKGRFEILQVHARKIKLDADVDLMFVARNTSGASGADLANMLNEAALLAASKNKTAVSEQDVLQSCDKVRYGKERRSLELDQNEKKTTAIHESGHAVVALIVKHSDPVEKVTIIPRGLSLGATHFMPTKNRVSYWKKELIDQLAVLMGGRVAEEVFIGDMSSGAQMDIIQATRLVRSMVCEWGMTDKLGTVAYDEKSEQGQYLGTQGYHEKNYSEETAKSIDEEVRKILDAAHESAKEIILSNRDKVELMTDMLMEFESLDRTDVKLIIDGLWDTDKKRAKEKDLEALNQKFPPSTSSKEISPKDISKSYQDPIPQH